MDSSSTSRFRFRDHQQGMGDSSESETGSEMSSVSGDQNDESEPESMTGKGIKRLCLELLELKRVTDEDFHKSIFSNYSAFVRIFEEVQRMENEMMQLKHHISTQKRLVKGLIDGIYLKALSEETVESIIEEPICAELSPLGQLEAHINEVLEALDTLLSENSLDQALTILEMEALTLQRIQLEENFSEDVLIFYKSAMSERKAKLATQLTLLAENPRIPALELQKALVGLCRLGESPLATQLLLKYYHSRIATGIYNLQVSKTFLQRVYIRELAKFVFSMISQAARSFVLLYGDTSPYASEFIQWACQETEVFAVCFNKYVKSISEISGGLSTAAEAVQVAMSFCSLLETQKIVLQPCLMKYIRPCMEQVLQIHMNHLKKVISIFTAIDSWALGRYLVSGILNEGVCSMVIGRMPEYCLLTNSGRKLVTLLQVIKEDVSPLVALQMEGSILSGLIDLFMEYVVILEKAMTHETNTVEKGTSRINLAESLPQQVAVLTNISTLVHFFSSIVTSIFNSISHFNHELEKSPSTGSLWKELDNCKLLIQEATERLRAQFCLQFIHKTMSVLTPETYVGGQGDSDMFNDAMPSIAFQVLFLELRKLEKLAEDNVVEAYWLKELLKELMEALFVWISENEIWTNSEEDLTLRDSVDFKQFVLDMQFLVEIARYGGYLSENMMNASLGLVSHLESALTFAGLDPKREVNDDGWAVSTSTEAIQKLLEMEKTKLHSIEEIMGVHEKELCEQQFECLSDSLKIIESFSEESVELKEDVEAINASEVASNTETDTPTIEDKPVEGSLYLNDEKDDSDAMSSINSTDAYGELEGLRTEHTESIPVDELQNSEETKLQATFSSGSIIGDASEAKILSREGTSSRVDGSELMNDKMEDSLVLHGQDERCYLDMTASADHSVKLQGQDERMYL